MVTEVRPEQPLKASLPIVMTELPMMTEVRPEQPQKALSPIEVTEAGIIIEVTYNATNCEDPVENQ